MRKVRQPFAASAKLFIAGAAAVTLMSTASAQQSLTVAAFPAVDETVSYTHLTLPTNREV